MKLIVGLGLVGGSTLAMLGWVDDTALGRPFNGRKNAILFILGGLATSFSTAAGMGIATAMHGE